VPFSTEGIVHGLERRGFLAEILAAIPILRAAGFTAPSQETARGVMVAAGEDRLRVKRAIGVSSTAFKVAADDTHHALFAMEQANTRFGGPPLHLHRDVDEFWYVVAGRYLIEVGSQRFEAGAGDCVLGPRNVPHRWAFVGDTPGRVLITFTPAGLMQEFFSRPRKSAAYTDDPALYRQYGMELLGPPIAKAGR
jgi:mannose-6-phosphate isomerase-like protein (cupin superfamily)